MTLQHEGTERFDKYVKMAIDAGSDSTSIFGGSVDGGYYLQQTPWELAELVCWLEDLGVQFKTWLEIGAAAGGTSRFLDDVFKFERLYVIDNNRLWQHAHRKRILPQAIEWIGDSHSEACKQQLDEWNQTFDLVHIDGDHSYEGAKQDLELVLPYCRKGTVILLHDVWHIAGPRKLAEEVRKGEYQNLKEVNVIFGPSNRQGISCLEVV